MQWYNLTFLTKKGKIKIFKVLFRKIIEIAYLMQILSDFKNSSFFGKPMKNLTDPNH